MKQVKLRVGDVVVHQRQKFIVAGTKGWVHRGGWISLARAIGETSLLTHRSGVKLLKRREAIARTWWKEFPKGEKS